jgi:flagellar hook-associated protein 3 FlgL
MRLSTTLINRIGVNAILEQQSKLSKTNLQVATGKRVLTPADDPAAAAKILDVNEAQEITKQYEANGKVAYARLVAEEDALTSVGNILQRARELAIQANNDTYSDQNRRSISLEIRQLLDQLLGLANKRDVNGEFLFAGNKSQSKPFAKDVSGNYVYSGDDGQRFLQVGPTRQIAAGDSGTEVFRAVKNGNGTFTTGVNAANTGTGVIDPGSVTDAAAYVADTYTIIGAERTAVTGGAIGIVDTGVNDVLQYELRINGTLVYTGGEGSTRTLAQLQGDINAQTGTTNVQAFVNGGVLYLANTAPSSTPITVTETLTGATEDTDVVTGYFGSNLSGLTTPSATITYGDATGYVVLDSASAIVTSGAYQAGSAITFNGMQTDLTGIPRNGDRFTIAPAVNQDIFATMENLITALEGGSPGAGIAVTAQFHNAMNRFLIDADQGISKMLDIRAAVGARLNAIDNQSDMNENYALNLASNLSDVQDLDYAEAVSRMNQELVGLEAAQKAFIKIQDLSLFNLLR